MKPIKPDEVVGRKKLTIPDAVIEAFNEMIIKRWNGGAATFTQNEVITEILRRSPDGTDRGTVFANRWLDVEAVYEAEGWRVEYDKPGYCETYEPTFTFRKKR